jgi:hypothetical protein
MMEFHAMQNTLKWHPRWYTFLPLLQEHSHLFLPPPTPPKKAHLQYTHLILYIMPCSSSSM